MKLIDTHAHLSSSEFDSDRAEVLSRALKTCDALIDIGAGTSFDAYQKACQLAESSPQIYFTVGIHPHDADRLGHDAEIQSKIESFLSHPKCVAIGECGLDYYYKNSSPENQRTVFRTHLEWGRHTGLPLSIHTREAEEHSIEELKDYSGPAIFHCFTGTKRLAEFAIQKDFYISFSGIVTFKKAEELRQIFLSIPLHRIVIETDAPFLAPVPHRGKRNESSFLEHTARFLASLRGISYQEFAEQTSLNARRLFSLPE